MTSHQKTPRQPSWPFTLTLALLGVMAGATADAFSVRGAVVDNALQLAEQRVLVTHNAERLAETNSLLERIVSQNTVMIEQNRLWLRQAIQQEAP